MKCYSLSYVRLFATLLTVDHQAPLCDFPNKNTGVGCHFLLQAIFPTQGSNPGLLHLLHWQEGSFSRGLSRPGIEPWSPTLQADSLPPEPSGNTPNARGQSHRSCHRHPCFWPPVGPTFHTPGPSQVLPAARGTRASSVKANQTARPSSLRPRSSLLNASGLVRGPPTPEAKRCAGTRPRPDRADTESARAALLCFSQDQSHTGAAPDRGGPS